MKCETISDVLDYYLKQVSRLVTAVQVTSGRFPEPIHNEIRSAMTHLARANALPQEAEQHREEVVRATRHLERVRLDCYKILVIVSADKCDKEIIRVSAIVGALDGELIRATEQLKQDRIALGVTEAEGDLTTTLRKYDDLVGSYRTLMDAFRQKYSTDYLEQLNFIHQSTLAASGKAQNQALWRGVIYGAIASFLISLVFYLAS